MGSPGKLWSVDRVVVVYNLVLATLWTFGWSMAPFAPKLVIAHLVAAAIPFLLARLDVRFPGRWITGIRLLYPIALIAAYWTEVGMIRDTFYNATYDQVVLDVQLAIMGVHLHETWLPAMPHLWLSELMQFVYVMYYPMVFFTPIVLVFQKRDIVARDTVFYVFITYLLCYVSFAIFPIDGPRFLMDRFEGENVNGFLYKIAESLHGEGDQTGAAFPSTHVAACTTAAFLAWRWFTRPVAIVFWVGAIGVILSTVYLQAHYAADSFAGIIVSVVAYFIVAPFLLRWFKDDEAESALAVRSDRGHER